MKKIVLAGVLSLATTTAMAEGFGPYVGIERETSAGVNRAYAGMTYAVPNTMLSIDAVANFEDTTGSLSNVSFATTELNINAALTENVSAYVENDLNSDFKRTETTVGVKFS